MESIIFMGNPLIDVSGLVEMIVRFAINFVAVGIIARYFYYPKSKRSSYLFNFMIMSVSIFMLIYLMEGAKMKTAAALGLFAIFGIIRYRTEAIPIREMTYLFLVVCLSVINAMAMRLSLAEIVVANLIFILCAYLFEKSKVMESECSKIIKYDNVGLATPERREELKADLEKRTGLKINRIEVGTLDFLKDSALIRIFYEDDGDVGNSIARYGKVPKEL